MKSSTILALLLVLASLSTYAQSTVPSAPISGIDSLGGLEGAVGTGFSTGELSLNAIKALVEKQGYTKITDVMPSPSDGMLHASAVNSYGIPTNLQINPANGAIISALAAH